MDEKKGLEGLLNGLGKNKKAVRYIVVLGIAGILLILLSEFLPSGAKNQGTAADEASPLVFSQEEYISSLENKILEIVTAIDGVGEARVMVTLKSTVEYVYATEENVTMSSVEENDETSNRGELFQSFEEAFVFVEDINGKKQALYVTQILPEIKGVVVVCEGGDTLAVRNDVINALTTGLGIFSNNVYVTKLSSAS